MSDLNNRTSYDSSLLNTSLSQSIELTNLADFGGFRTPNKDLSLNKKPETVSFVESSNGSKGGNY